MPWTADPRGRWLTGLVGTSFILLSLLRSETAGSEPESPQVLDVARVWSGHPVGFALLTTHGQQLVAFYDSERQMTVAGRKLDQRQWQFARLPSVLGWDSHNYVTMAVDPDGQIHLSGNMHCQPLVYFRTERPLDIQSFRRMPAMIGRNEQRCTYPRFLRGSRGELIFTYRDGRSGSGDQYCNVYDPATCTWRRLLDSPLFSGAGKMNAYFTGPTQDPQGVFHLCWVWRNTPDCATNHDLCYAKSRDLVHWQASDGRALALPITLASAEVVDPVPPGGGIINGNTKLGFDYQGRAILSYHKFDAQGKTQIYNARREAEGWRIYQASDWDYRWEFQGGGSIRFEIGLGPVVAHPDGSLTQSYHHAKKGPGAWKLDPKDLKPLGQVRRPARRPAGPASPRPDWPEMAVRTAEDLGASAQPGVRYRLRWETLPANRDRARSGPLPPPSMLRLEWFSDGEPSH